MQDEQGLHSSNQKVADNHNGKVDVATLHQQGQPPMPAFLKLFQVSWSTDRLRAFDEQEAKDEAEALVKEAVLTKAAYSAASSGVQELLGAILVEGKAAQGAGAGAQLQPVLPQSELHLRSGPGIIFVFRRQSKSLQELQETAGRLALQQLPAPVALVQRTQSRPSDIFKWGPLRGEGGDLELSALDEWIMTDWAGQKTLVAAWVRGARRVGRWGEEFLVLRSQFASPAYLRCRYAR